MRIFLTIENNSEWAHFKDGTPKFQNFQKNQNFVENSLRKIKTQIRFSKKIMKFLGFFDNFRKFLKSQEIVIGIRIEIC